MAKIEVSGIKDKIVPLVKQAEKRVSNFASKITAKLKPQPVRDTFQKQVINVINEIEKSKDGKNILTKIFKEAINKEQLNNTEVKELVDRIPLFAREKFFKLIEKIEEKVSKKFCESLYNSAPTTSTMENIFDMGNFYLNLQKISSYLLHGKF